MTDEPSASSPATPPPSSGGGGVWRTVGVILAVLMAVGGLAAVGVVILFVIAFNSYGSNK